MDTVPRGCSGGAVLVFVSEFAWNVHCAARLQWWCVAWEGRGAVVAAVVARELVVQGFHERFLRERMRAGQVQTRRRAIDVSVCDGRCAREELDARMFRGTGRGESGRLRGGEVWAFT